jgi:drug/metabolite transporter (DMT)-like permease
MPWQVSITLFFIFVTIFSLYRRTFSQKTKLPGNSAIALAYLTGTVPLGVTVGLFIGDLRIDWSVNAVSSLLIMATFIGLFNWFAFQSSRKLNVATFLTIIQIYTVVAVVGSWLFLNETLTGIQIFGGTLLLFGAVLAAQAHKPTATKKETKVSAVLLAILAGFALGSGIVAEKSALESVSIGAYFIVGFGLQTIAICLIAAKDLAKLKWSKVEKSDWSGVITYGITSTLVGFFFIATVTSTDNVALVATLASFQMPLGALAGYFILKEKEVGWKLALAITTAFIGLIITAA